MDMWSGEGVLLWERIKLIHLVLSEECLTLMKLVWSMCINNKIMDSTLIENFANCDIQWYLDNECSVLFWVECDIDIVHVMVYMGIFNAFQISIGKIVVKSEGIFK